MLHPLMRFTKILGLSALVFCVLGATPGFAQSFAGSSGINTESLRQASCTSDVRRLEVLVSELEDFADWLDTCSESDQVYNGTQCVDLARVAHEWRADGSVASGMTLVFSDGGIEYDPIEVIYGRDGETPECPNAPEEPAPEPEVPVACSAPWGGTVAHGSSITAYDAATVPAGESCESQTRRCDNGTLSGTYTQQTCTVEEPEPEEPSCRWMATGTYATQQVIPESIMDSACGDMEWSACTGCANFPFTSNCEAGAACNPDGLRNCLKNERSCRSYGARMWDRMYCACSR